MPQDNTLKNIASQLSELMDQLGEYYIVIGDTVEGKENVYKSYSSAVILLQKSFFEKPRIIITKKEEDKGEVLPLSEVRELSGSYMKAVEDSDKAKAETVLNTLGSLNEESGILENQIKAIYHDMLLHLYKTRKKHSLVTDMSMDNQETIMDIVDKCFYFDELHGILREKTDSYFSDTEEELADNPTIRIICEYIANNYENADLSVKSISDHAALSTSYACTYFKNETGMTLNQYITDFRMKKAKKLLTDPRNKVNEVSLAVGYSDGNYFAKSFKKYTGLSPSEYREQVIRS
jgi:two-component system response regulator YesN